MEPRCKTSHSLIQVVGFGGASTAGPSRGGASSGSSSSSFNHDAISNFPEISEDPDAVPKPLVDLVAGPDWEESDEQGSQGETWSGHDGPSAGRRHGRGGHGPDSALLRGAKETLGELRDMTSDEKLRFVTATIANLEYASFSYLSPH